MTSNKKQQNWEHICFTRHDLNLNIGHCHVKKRTFCKYAWPVLNHWLLSIWSTSGISFTVSASQLYSSCPWETAVICHMISEAVSSLRRKSYRLNSTLSRTDNSFQVCLISSGWSAVMTKLLPGCHKPILAESSDKCPISPQMSEVRI